MKTSLVFVILLSTLNPQLSTCLAQGSLTPPAGTPAPIFKTLEQIEPRIDLQNAPALAVDTGNANYHFIINQSGSYYLSANLGVTKSNGIQINAEGVTLDLNGFQISRSSGTGGNGIELAGPAHRATMRNGSIKAFAYGIRDVGGVRAGAFRDLVVSGCTIIGIEAPFSSVLESCRAHDNIGGYGIYADAGSSLTNCTASNNNPALYGIYAETGCSLTNCAAYNNSGQYGIAAQTGSTLTNCTASNNSGTYGIFAGAGSSLANCTASNNTCTYGIYAADASLANCSALANHSNAGMSAGIAGFGCTISHCTSKFNFSTATSTPTTGMGFLVGIGSTIQNCTAALNEGDGINLSIDTVARENTCNANGNDGDGAGIHATSNDNRIEGNNVTDNDRGIDVDVGGNVIIKNTARGNTTNNWDVATGNVILVVNATTAGAVTGNSGGTAPGSTDPNANFTY